MSVPDAKTLRQAKSDLRKSARTRRAALATDPTADNAGLAGRNVVSHFRAGPALTLSLPPGAVFSAYMPMGSEIDTKPLILHLIETGLVCALPVVGAGAAPLTFFPWQPGDPLVSGPFGTQEPSTQNPQLQPELILLPLLAFDLTGHRLGYGGGFYDRTLAAYRDSATATTPVTAVGLAFAGQMVETVPVGPTDQLLDWVVTENGARRFSSIP